MRVALVHDTVDFWLAGEPEVAESVHSQAGDLEFGGEAIASPIYYVPDDDADGIPPAQWQDRQNDIHQITFSTSRLFATRQLAELWAMDYDTAWPRTGTLRIEAADTTLTMAGTIVLPPVRRVIGRTVLLQYTAQGAALTVPE
jgi:hypothetical protein